MWVPYFLWKLRTFVKGSFAKFRYILSELRLKTIYSNGSQLYIMSHMKSSYEYV